MKFTHYRGGMLIAVLCAGVMAGCATYRIQNIKKDAVSGTKEYNSVAYWHLRVKDNRVGITRLTPCLYISSYDDKSGKWVPLKEDDNGKEFPYVGIGKAVGGFSMQDGAPVLDLTVFKQVKPGRYLLDKIRLVSDSFKPLNGGTINYIDFYVDKIITVSSGSAQYLGLFDIDMVAASDRTFHFNFETVQKEPDARACFALFKEQYPALAGHFKEKTVTAALHPLEARRCSTVILDEDFARNTRGWSVSLNNPLFEMSFNNGAYVMETKNDRYTNSLIDVKSMPFDKATPQHSTDCNIDLVSTWQSGGKDLPYGLSVGSRHTMYGFFVAKNGKAAIFEFRGGACVQMLPWTDCGPFVYGRDVKQTVCVANGSAAYFVNGKYVGRVNTFLREGFDRTLGVTVGGQQKVTFRRLTVTSDKK